MSVHVSCFLCSSPNAKSSSSSALDDVTLFDCPNCGKYGITDQALLATIKDKYKFSSIIKERALKRLGEIIITYDNDGITTGRICMKLDSIASLFPRTASEFIDRALMNLGNSIEYPSDTIKLDDNSRALLFSRTQEDMLYFLQQMAELDYIPKIGSLPTNIRIKARAWDRISKLNSMEIISNQAFVAMWFDKSTEVFFEKGFKPAVEYDKKTICLRIDKSQHNNKICDQIIAEIRRCKYLIADFTGNRGGVYFEAGFAMGLGKPVIWTVQKTHLKDVHFDTRQYNHICYTNENDLFERLKHRIQATIPKL